MRYQGAAQAGRRILAGNLAAPVTGSGYSNRWANVCLLILFALHQAAGHVVVCMSASCPKRKFKLAAPTVSSSKAVAGYIANSIIGECPHFDFCRLVSPDSNYP